MGRREYYSPSLIWWGFSETTRHSTHCAIYDMDIEITHHLFVDCELAVKLWDSIAVWWGFSDALKFLDSLLKLADTVNLNVS